MLFFGVRGAGGLHHGFRQETGAFEYRCVFVRGVSSMSIEEAKRNTGFPVWTFLSNHGHVLFCIYREEKIRLREIANLVGITERMVQKIVTDLAAAGYVKVEKEGRCNHYYVNPAHRMRHPLFRSKSVGQMLDALNSTEVSSSMVIPD
jgi:DNA-binding MarR family transcriptional regulator